MCKQYSDSDLTATPGVGTMKEGGEGRRPEPKVGRRASGPAALSLNDFILRLHTFFRDQAAAMKDPANDLSAWEQLAALTFELAELTHEEYDKRHGK